MITGSTKTTFSHLCLQNSQQVEFLFLIAFQRIEHANSAIDGGVEYPIWFFDVHRAVLNSCWQLSHVVVNQRLHIVRNS